MRSRLPRAERPSLAWASLLLAGLLVVAVGGCRDVLTPVTEDDDDDVGAELDRELLFELEIRGFTGRVEETLESRLGRPVDGRLAELGRLLFFDPILSLTGDNSCSGCHGPNVSFNDSQSIAIGVGNNGVVGPGRRGPHNIRRAPTILNAAFYPRLMWDNRFRSNALDPFDNGDGFTFPEPDGAALSFMEHLLGAQAFTPVVDRAEMAGDFDGDVTEMRAEVARRVDAIDEYRTLFAEVVPEIADGRAVEYADIAAALAEFTFTLVRADAPIDRYARGDTSALTPDEKRGGILFYGRRASCFECHITEGYASEMFSDFDTHVIAVPQVTPTETNVDYDGPAGNEDFGLERATGDPADRYEFRTSPLRNVAYQPSFMHNGAFICLENAIRHHTDVYESLDGYTTNRLDASLRGPLGPVQPMLDRIHRFSKEPRDLTADEIGQITAFVGSALSDPDAAPSRLAHLVPVQVPSGLPVHQFDFSRLQRDCF